MYDWKDKIVVVTGGASGMGRSFVTHILSCGGFVSFGDVNTALSKSLLLQIHSSAPRLVSRLLFTQTDIRQPTQLKLLFTRTLELFGKIDCLLCVAGVNVPDSFLPQSAPYPHGGANLLSVEVNLMGTINTVYAGLAHLKDHARIVVISSAVGLYPSSVQPIYSASKHGLIGFSRALAPLLSSSQRIFVLAPSTYLPPHQNNSHGLSMSQQMDQSGDEDTFTTVIRNTLGFIDMKVILQTLNQALVSSDNGQVWEITPMGINNAKFARPPEQMIQMEKTLRERLCKNVDTGSTAEVKVKDELMEQT